MLKRLDEIDWLELQDAYGPADSVAEAIRALLSDDPEKRDSARWSLSSTICHQGDIFNSTAAALPFLVEIFVADGASDRAALGEFMDAIAQSAEIADTQIRDNWNWKHEKYPDVFPPSDPAKTESVIADTRALQDAFLACEADLRIVIDQPPKELADISARLCVRLATIQEVVKAR